MSRGLNKIMLIGNVGSDPDVRMTSSGSHVSKFSLATNRTWRDKAGNQQEKVDWHRVTCFGKLGEIVEKWVHKGDRIYVEGRVEYSQTQDDAGGTRYWTDVIAQELIMLGSSSGGDGSNGGSSREEYEDRRSGQGQQQEQKKQAPIHDPEDDLPFSHSPSVLAGAGIGSGMNGRADEDLQEVWSGEWPG